MVERAAENSKVYHTHPPQSLWSADDSTQLSCFGPEPAGHFTLSTVKMPPLRATTSERKSGQEEREKKLLASSWQELLRSYWQELLAIVLT